jgi:signal peptidase II
MRAFRTFGPGLLVAAAVIALDQGSKWLMVEKVMRPPRVIPVTPFFNLVIGWNRGVSFGLFNSGSPLNNWLLPAVAMVIVIVLLVWMRKSKGLMTAASLGLIIGGALGNVIDRFRYGAVIDFLDFYLGSYHWPAFNLADSAITIGAVVLIADSLFKPPEKN